MARTSGVDENQGERGVMGEDRIDVGGNGAVAPTVSEPVAPTLIGLEGRLKGRTSMQGIQLRGSQMSTTTLKNSDQSPLITGQQGKITFLGPVHGVKADE